MSSDAAWEAFSGRLFDQNRFAIKLGLDNMRRAFALQGDPQRCAPAIVVGGTNGKGSVSSALAAILQAHGLRVGLYTSPHLIEVRERFRINGVPVSRDEVLTLGAAVLERFGQPESNPCLTFFELTTLLAAQIFARERVDVAVWEVGLGGRLDAVNAIEPALTVITNIDLDHQQYLGDTIELVAAEKAGLRRDGVPLVLAPQTHARVYEVFGREAPSQAVTTTATSAEENTATALEAARLYLGSSFDGARAAEGLSHHRWPGRLDHRVARGAQFLLDAAHNPAGTARLAALMAERPPRRVIIGAMADKDLEGMFRFLARMDVEVMVAKIASERAASPDAIAEAVGRPVAGHAPAGGLFDAAPAVGYTAVFGSIYLLGEWFAWAGIDASELVTFQPSSTL